MGIGPGAGSSRFALGLVGGGGGSTAGESVEDLTQNPAFGESSMRTRVEDDILEDVHKLSCFGNNFRKRHVRKTKNFFR